MKIIKQGKLPLDEEYNGVCHYCNTEIEFLRREAKYTSDQRDGDYLSIACPTCNNNITVAIGCRSLDHYWYQR